MAGVERFLNAFMQGNVAFLAGSGICFRPGVPRADEILDHTAQVFLNLQSFDELPSRFRNLVQQEALRANIFTPSPPAISIQPKVLYENLLLLSNDDPAILGLWETLCPSKWKNPPSPSLTHYAIVAYSIRNRIPILTTNFDSLFEKAYASLSSRPKVDPEVLVSSQARLDRLTAPINNVRIIKLHGTIGDEDRCDTSSIQTTMTSIAVTNFDFLSYLGKIMTEKSIAVVGYSGRDIDLFPAIRNLSFRKKTIPIFWFDRFDNEPTISNCESLANVIKVPVYPDDVFSQNYQQWSLRYLGRKDRQRIPGLQHSVVSGEKQNILTKKTRALEREFSWNDAKKLLFIGSLYSFVGKFVESYNILRFLRNKALLYRSLAATDRAHLLYKLCSAAHNNSRFQEHASLSKQLSSLSSPASSKLRRPVKDG